MNNLNFRTFFLPRDATWLGLLILIAIGANLAYAITSALTMFTPKSQPVGYVAQDEVTNFNLTSGNELIFRPDYERQFWSGNLYAYPVDASGSINFDAEPWVGGAAAQLATQNWDSGRYIATRNAASPSTAIPFRYSSLSTSQQAFFPNSTIGTTAYTGNQIVNFLRGERLNESPTGMRNRSNEPNGSGGPTLGDIIHSRPFYVADATNPTVFVGANDGMLHAFNVTTGKERWAYVPSMLLNKMAKLASPYGGVSNPHDYFVDGRVNIRSISLSGTPTRILVGSLGAGGRGLYALNIEGSSGLAAGSESDVAGKALWEIDGTASYLNNAAPTVSGAYDNLGYTYGTPAIVKVNNGASGVDAVVVGNGYNDNALGDFQAYLYVINAASGQLIASVQAGSSGSATSPNGLFNPAPVDTNADGIVDRVYAGDLKGTLWKFDISSATAASWTATALHTTSPAQPIVVSPGVSLHPNGGIMVTFGTGTMFDDADASDTSTYYVYGIWDGAPVANVSLMSPTLEERSYVRNGVTTRVRRAMNITTPNWSSGGHKGWKVALPAGERMVGEGSFITSGRYYFTSHKPTVSVLSGASSVTSVTVTNGGSGYTSAAASFSGGGGSGASATPIISAGSIVSVQVSSSGTGYTSAPTVTITGNGSGATATAALSAGTTVRGENWLMELDFLSGGSKTTPFLDLDDNQILDNGDRIKYIGTDTIPTGSVVGDPIPGSNGVPVGKFLANGVMSQPILVQLQTLNTSFFNRNANTVYPYTEVTYGVTGGHFDTDIFYNGATGNLCTTSTGVNVPASKATATITVGTTGQTANLPATLGGVEVEGVTIIPAQTVTNITNGVAMTTNATTLTNAITGGYTATRSGNVITISAPSTGPTYNGKVLTVLDGTTQAGTPLIPGTPATTAIWPTGLITFSGRTENANPGTQIQTTLSGGASLKVGTTVVKNTNITVGKDKRHRDVVSAIVAAVGTAGTIKAYVGGDAVTPACAAMNNQTLCLVDTSGAYNNNGQTVEMGNLTQKGTLAWTISPTAGGTLASAGTPDTPATGWSNFKPALTVTPFVGGADALTNVTVTSSCSSINGYDKAHIHQYDDKYDRTGLDMLNPSATTHLLSSVITNTTVKYKVLVHNQYLNPAVKLHIGDNTYDPSVDHGYVSVKNFETSATLNLADLPTYNGNTKATGSTGTGFQPIGSLVYNMPVDALSAKDWWGNGDVRVGLHPIEPGCGGRTGSTTDGNLYQPVIPPTNGVDGPGVKGWSASTVSLTSRGVRHGGALTIQLIKDTTPQSAIELNDPLGRPEYGWRVKSEYVSAYVLVEYTVFWHHPTNGCYFDVGWTKTPGADNGASTPQTPAAGSTDPKIGDLSGSGGGTVTSVTRNVTSSVVGNVTTIVTTITITYSTGAQAVKTITEVINADGSKDVTTRTCDADGNCVTDIAHADSVRQNIVAGGDERGTRAHTGRVSWHELIND